MSDISAGAVTLDLQPYFDQLEKAQTAAGQLSAAAQAAGDATSKSFAAAASAAAGYSDALATGTAEVRSAQAATRSATDEVRKLVDANRDLEQARKNTNSTTAEYQRLTNELSKNNAKIREAKQAIDENKQAADQERTAVQSVQEARRLVTNETKLASAAAKDLTVQVRAEAAAQKEADKAAITAAKEKATAEKAAAVASKEAQANSGGAQLGNVGSSIAQILGVASAIAIATKAISFVVDKIGELRDATAQFEKTQTILTGVFNGDKARADRELSQIEELGQKLPFAIEQVETAYLKLDETGLKPTTTSLRQIADLAAANGKSFEEASNAIIAGSLGAMRGLRQLKIVGQVSGDEINFTFKGVKTTVENTQEAIAKYVLSLGDVAGVAGQAAAQLNTINGASARAANGLSELYEVLGNRAKGAFSGFNEVLATSALALAQYFKTADRKAIDDSAKGIENYEARVKKSLTGIAQSTKDIGGNVSEAVANKVKEQSDKANADLAKAQAAAERFKLPDSERKDAPGYDYSKNVDYYHSFTSGSNDDAGTKKYAEAQRVALANLKEAEGNVKALKKVSAEVTDTFTDQSKELGAIEALEKKITAEKLLQSRINDKAIDKDNPLGGGQSRRNQLAEQARADEEALKKLRDDVVKTKKPKKGPSDKKPAALRALYAERETLRSLAAKAVEKDSTDQSLKAKLAYEEALQQIKNIEKKLIERELAVRKAGGTGANADGKLDGVQAKELGKLSTSATTEYFKALDKISDDRDARLLALQPESDQKEVKVINNKYDLLAKAAKDGVERTAIQEARLQALTDQRAKSSANSSQTTLDGATADANVVGQTFGRGTVSSEIDAKRKEQRLILEAQLAFNKESLNNTQNKTDKEGVIIRQALKAQQLAITDQIKALDVIIKANDFSLAKLILGKDDDGPNGEKRGKVNRAITDVTQAAFSALNEINAAQEQAAQQRSQNATQRINELSSQLAAEVQLNANGSASNIKGVQAEIAQQKVLRRQAMDDQRTAAREKVLLDTIIQASSIATAVADIFAATAFLNSVPGLGLAVGLGLSAAVVGAFAASKVNAFQAAGNVGQGFYEGGYTGDGGKYEAAGTVHRGEFVANQELTRSYRPLFDALHTGQAVRWDTPEMRQLLPDFNLPGQLRAEKQASIEHHYRLSMEPMQAKFDGMEAKLSAIEGHVARSADRPDTLATSDGFMWVDPATGSTHRVKMA